MRLTWRAGPDGADVASEPTWPAGPPRRYDVALRPRGTTRMAHAEVAPSGREATSPRGRPCGAPRVTEEIVGQLIGESFPLFKRVLLFYFFRVGLCSHTVLTLQVTWRHGGRRIQPALIAERGSRGPESTRSPDQTRA